MVISGVVAQSELTADQVVPGLIPSASGNIPRED